MKNSFRKYIPALLVFLLVAISGSAGAVNKPCTIVLGASLASSNFAVVTDSFGNETIDSRNTLLRGEYVGLCETLQRAVDAGRKISCPAQAGGFSTDIPFPFINGTTINTIGYATQFDKGVKECTWNGQLLADSVVITVTNDGPFAIEPTKDLVDRAHALGIANVIVQGYPEQMPDFQREKDTALVQHGAYWGALIQALLAHVPTESEYRALLALHQAELEFYPGVTSYLDFYRDGLLKTIDGTHPAPETQQRAAFILMQAIEKN